MCRPGALFPITSPSVDVFQSSCSLRCCRVLQRVAPQDKKSLRKKRGGRSTLLKEILRDLDQLCLTAVILEAVAELNGSR